MWDVSDQFDAALRRSHSIVVKADLYSDGDFVQSLNVQDGSITIDESSQVRRTLSMTCTDVNDDPVNANDLLSPFGTVEIRTSYGLSYTDGSTELIPTGIFRVTTPSRDSILSPLQIVGDDWSKAINEARFLLPWHTPAGNAIADEIASMVAHVDQSWTVLDLTGSAILTAKATFTGNRWDAIESLASAIGAEVFCAPDAHTIVLQPVTILDADSVADWSVNSNADDASMLDLGTGMSADNVYNAVVATSSAPGNNPVTGIAYQQSGPLAWSDQFKRPRFYSSPVLKTTDQCQSAAAAILARSVIYSRQLSPQAIPNPALDVGDVVNVSLPDGSSELRVCSQIVLPLSPGPMNLSTRTAIDYTTTTDAGELS